METIVKKKREMEMKFAENIERLIDETLERPSIVIDKGLILKTENGDIPFDSIMNEYFQSQKDYYQIVKKHQKKMEHTLDEMQKDTVLKFQTTFHDFKSLKKLYQITKNEQVTKLSYLLN